jgi:hypothetical protein
MNAEPKLRWYQYSLRTLSTTAYYLAVVFCAGISTVVGWLTTRCLIPTALLWLVPPGTGAELGLFLMIGLIVLPLVFCLLAWYLFVRSRRSAKSPSIYRFIWLGIASGATIPCICMGGMDAMSVIQRLPFFR